MNRPKAPTRKELETFLKDQRLIKAFEELFNLVPSEFNNLEERIDANEIRSKSNEVLLWISM